MVHVERVYLCILSGVHTPDTMYSPLATYAYLFIALATVLFPHSELKHSLFI